MSGEEFSNVKDFPPLPQTPGTSTDKTQINESLEAQIAAAAAAAAKSTASDTGGGATKTAEQLLERRRKLAYVPEGTANPFPRRPASLTSRMPQLYDRHGNKTYDALAKKSNSSMNAEVMQWITEGCKLRWEAGPPPVFDHGVSLLDTTPQQLQWLKVEKDRLLANGAWSRAKKRSHVSRAFQVPKPGTNKWRLVVDFRWLNQWCLKSKMRMETLKKLRKLAKPDDWCFTFDLQDGFHALGIHKDFQKFMQFDIQGELFQQQRIAELYVAFGTVQRYDGDGRTVPVGVPRSASGTTLPKRAVFRSGGETQLGIEGEDFTGGEVRPRVVVEATGDEQVERTQDLEASDESEVAHRLFNDSLG
ncbi:hypothetical protein CYMTET_28986, partial [Cymbomonas tetramitiformis]